LGAGTLGGGPEAQEITSQILGVVLAAAGAVVTRAEQLDVKKDSVSAKLRSMSDLDPGEARISIVPGPALPPAIPAAATTGTPTYADLLALARADHWAVAQTTGAGHLTLTKTGVRPTAGTNLVNTGDTVTVVVPIDALLSPVPARTLAVMQAAGLRMSS
jgi:hypothetical protein